MGKAIVVFVDGKLEVVCTNKTNAWLAVQAKTDIRDLYVQGKKTPWLPASYGQVALKLGQEAHSCSMFTKVQTEIIDGLGENDPNPRPACRLLQMEMNVDRDGNLFKSGETEIAEKPSASEPAGDAGNDGGDAGDSEPVDPQDNDGGTVEDAPHGEPDNSQPPATA